MKKFFKVFVYLIIVSLLLVVGIKTVSHIEIKNQIGEILLTGGDLNKYQEKSWHTESFKIETKFDGIIPYYHISNLHIRDIDGQSIKIGTLEIHNAMALLLYPNEGNNFIKVDSIDDYKGLENVRFFSKLLSFGENNKSKIIVDEVLLNDNLVHEIVMKNFAPFIMSSEILKKLVDNLDNGGKAELSIDYENHYNNKTKRIKSISKVIAKLHFIKSSLTINTKSFVDYSIFNNVKEDTDGIIEMKIDYKNEDKDFFKGHVPVSFDFLFKSVIKDTSALDALNKGASSNLSLSLSNPNELTTNDFRKLNNVVDIFQNQQLLDQLEIKLTN